MAGCLQETNEESLNIVCQLSLPVQDSTTESHPVPQDGFVSIFFDSATDQLSYKNSSGVVHVLDSSSSGVVTRATQSQVNQGVSTNSYVSPQTLYESDMKLTVDQNENIIQSMETQIQELQYTVSTLVSRVHELESYFTLENGTLFTPYNISVTM